MKRLGLCAALLLLCVTGGASARPGGVWLSMPGVPGGVDGTVNGQPEALVRVGEDVVVRGHVAGVAHGVRLELQDSDGAEPPIWRTLAPALRHGSNLVAHLRPTRRLEPAEIRFAIVNIRGELIAAGRPLHLTVGPAPVPCLAPHVPALPAGDGAIVGGVVLVGGPAPGIVACGAGSSSVVTLSESSGPVLDTQTISGRQSYVFVVPPGTYELAAGTAGGFAGCRGHAVVLAGRVTTADAFCPVP